MTLSLGAGGKQGRAPASIGCVLCLGLAACSDETAGTGSLSVLLEAEDVIVGGLQAGERSQDIRDGWSVHFEKYLIAIGDVHLRHAGEGVEAHGEHVYVADLTRIPESGLELWQFEGLRSGRWEFSYATPGARDARSRHSNVSAADFREMQDQDWTYWIQGTLTRADGRSCPPVTSAKAPSAALPVGNNSGGDDCYAAPTVRFELGARAATHYGLCEVDGLPGVSIPVGGTQTASATIHGDHLFFNGFPAGGEGGVLRLAQWLADSDLNLDGVVTTEELADLAPAELPEIDHRFQMGGSPLSPLDTMYTYLQAQFKTQGHFQGEGECEIDGVQHEHEHDDAPPPHDADVHHDDRDAGHSHDLHDGPDANPRDATPHNPPDVDAREGGPSETHPAANQTEPSFSPDGGFPADASSGE